MIPHTRSEHTIDFHTQPMMHSCAKSLPPADLTSSKKGPTQAHTHTKTNIPNISKPYRSRTSHISTFLIKGTPLRVRWLGVQEARESWFRPRPRETIKLTLWAARLFHSSDEEYRNGWPARWWNIRSVADNGGPPTEPIYINLPRWGHGPWNSTSLRNRFGKVPLMWFFSMEWV